MAIYIRKEKFKLKKNGKESDASEGFAVNSYI